MARRQEHLRQRNLELLIAEAGSATKLARAVGTNNSYLSQVRHQIRIPSGGRRRVGDELAEKLERGMRKPEGWMDESHEQEPYEASVERSPYGEANIRNLCPLISWVQAGGWAEISRDYTPECEAELFHCPVRCSRSTFVLRIRGISMEPRFCEDDLIFVDPEMAPVHGKYVVLRLEASNEATFKQLVIEGSRHYLKALNPIWPERMIEVNAAVVVCGVVVFKGDIV